MVRYVLFCLLSALAFVTARADDCVDCHKKTTPGVVADWQLSKHSTAKDGASCGTCQGKAHKIRAIAGAGPNLESSTEVIAKKLPQMFKAGTWDISGQCLLLALC
jgi:hypothetical protein